MKQIMLSIILLTTISTSVFSSDGFDWMHAEKGVVEDTIKHKCPRPINSSSFTDNREIKRYNEKVKHYSSCIKDFVNKYQNNDKHFDAVNNAIKEWNSFAKSTQKEKSDTMTFTGSTGVSNGGAHTVGHSDPSKISTDWKF